MAAQTNEEREEKASSSRSIMADFYVLNQIVYVAVRDAHTLVRAMNAPDAGMWIPHSETVRADMVPEERAKHATDYNIFKEKGLDSDGVFVLGELEMIVGDENNIELVPK